MLDFDEAYKVQDEDKIIPTVMEQKTKKKLFANVDWDEVLPRLFWGGCIVVTISELVYMIMAIVKLKKK